MDQLFHSGNYTYRVLPDGTAEITKYSGNAKTVNIPYQLDEKIVTKIGNEAFSGCDGLTSVTIPDSITFISDNAFSNCADDLTLTIQKDSYAEKYCRENGLKYRYPDATPSSEQDADSRSHKSVSESHAQSKAPQLDDASMRKVVDMLISLFAPEMANKCGDYTFNAPDDDTAEITKYSGNAETLKIPSKMNARIVTGIGKGAFYRCGSLVSVTIPDSVTSIGKKAFYQCNSLESVTIPNSVKSISDSAFFGCCMLTSVTIPEGVTSISDSAFFGCMSLPSITIPEGVTSIGDGAFVGCSCLPTIKIPGSVTRIGARAFLNCNGLKSVTIPEGVTSIGSAAFGVCGNLTSVTIPDSVTSIGEFAFINCAKELVLTVPKGSYAEQYCRENGLKYKYPEA